MGRRKVTYYQVSCDYSDHIPEDAEDAADLQTELPKSAVYHLIGGRFVICGNCWENKLVVETLLDEINVTYMVTNVGRDLEDG